MNIEICLRDGRKLALAVAAVALALAGGIVRASYAADGAEFYVVQGLPGEMSMSPWTASRSPGMSRPRRSPGRSRSRRGHARSPFSDSGDVRARTGCSRSRRAPAGTWSRTCPRRRATSRSSRCSATTWSAVRRQGVAGRGPHRGGPAGRHPGERQGAVREHRQRRVAEADRSGGTYKVAIVPTGETKPVDPRAGRADRQGRRGQPGVRGGRPGEEDDERRRACDRRPAPAGRASRPRSTPGPAARRSVQAPSLVVNLVR